MSSLALLMGWPAAGIAAALLGASRRMLGARTEAVARACHELRGPLAAARLGLSLGSRGGQLPPGRLRAIDIELGRAALALDDLTGMRGVVRVGELEPVDVRQLVLDSTEAWRGSAEAAGVSLRIADRRDATRRLACPRGGAAWDEGGSRQALIVWGDRLRLAQALGNLLANGIAHGAATVRIGVERRERLVRVEVADDGPGLPAPVSELVRRGRRARGAHGHGLAVAAAVAQAHGGRLASAPAQTGARLVLELPASPRG